MNTLPSIYKTKTISLSIEHLKVKMIVVINFEEVYEALLKKDMNDAAVVDERIPYWTDLWASSIALSQHLVKSSHINKKTNVLEIGCGLGLPGIVAGMLGAKVTMTDYDEESLLFARHNWDLNNTSSATFQTLDWRKPDKTMAADVLLASDVAYERSAFKFLTKAFKTLINRKGIILISEPNREYAQTFFKNLSSNGFTVKKNIYNIEFNKMQSKINVFEVTRK